MFQIQGSGNIIARERAVSSFVRLHISSHGLIELIQSDEEKVIVECDDNLQDYVQVGNSGRTLFISEESGIRRAVYTRLIVKVYLRQIDTLTINSEGDTRCVNTIVCKSLFKLVSNSEGDCDISIDAPEVKATFRCEGNVTMRGRADDANIRTMMEGNFYGKEFLVARLKFRGVSEGNTELFSSESISIKHMSEGFVHYYGPGTLKDIRHFGEGEVKHME